MRYQDTTAGVFACGACVGFGENSCLHGTKPPRIPSGYATVSVKGNIYSGTLVVAEAVPLQGQLIYAESPRLGHIWHPPRVFSIHSFERASGQGRLFFST